MLVRAMDRQECEELLARLNFGRLACARDNRRHVSSPRRGCTPQEGCAVTSDTVECDGRHSGSRAERTKYISAGGGP